MAMQLERALLEGPDPHRYLNTVYFGNGAYGVAGRGPDLLRRGRPALASYQAALLAGIVRSPTAYDPVRHPRRGDQAPQPGARRRCSTRR